ncbi:DgyrCDS6149 [Dimorphilus gyrociliatus]|uniref:carbonyl reductase (NADPH) n=1 Tax=Dimorphilus gyrociliatus TaxID=2664684 RepID=A0A7I8VMY4_9ANNE|nr:DgyrCDS6149 [Dimorphilus gyrociliatus]
MSSKVAIVTGSNKGVGFGIVRGLCKKFDGDVYLTARNQQRGEAAVELLKKEGLSPKFHVLDIDNEETIMKIRDFLKEKYGGLDLLVNNAGIAYKGNATEPFGEQAEVTCKTNVYSTIRACEILFPILKPKARVVHLSSLVCLMSFSKSKPNIQSSFRNAKTIDDVKKLISDFVEAAKSGNHLEKGWPNTAYGVSKMGVSAITHIQQKEFDKDGRHIIVNSCCPGYVDTDMTSHKGVKTIDEGAQTPLWLSLMDENSQVYPRGEFCQEMRISKWMA